MSKPPPRPAPWLVACALGLLVLMGSQPATAEPDGALGSDFDESPPSDTDDDGPSTAAADSSRFTLQFQAGLLFRIGGTDLGNRRSDTIVNLDLTALFGDRRDFTWGLGFHVTLGEKNRLGLKVPLRFPLGRGSRSYFQLSPGAYLDAEGSMDIPSFFCEAELGHTNMIAAVVSLEILSFTYWGSWSPDPVHTQSITNINAGIKLGQLPGVLAVVATTVIAAIALSGSNY